MLLDILMLVVGGFLVWRGAEWLVNGAVRLADYYGVSAMVVGLTVVAFGTSAPELVVSSVAAARGYSEIALGNVLGSNIINIALVLGIAAVITPIAISRDVFIRDLPIVAAVSLLVVILAVLGDEISRFDGILLLILFAGYTVYTFVLAFRENRRTTMQEEWKQPEFTRKDLILLLTGIPVLAIGAEGMVRGAVGVAETIGISKQIIAMTIVAFGTSLPELAASAVAARKGEGDLSVGNVLGSNLYNMTLILGTASIIQPISTRFTLMSMDILFFLLVLVVLFLMAVLRRRISRFSGIILLLVYISSVALLYLFPTV